MASEYYVVSFDDHQGNLGRKNELTDFLKQNGFRCMAGYWGCPWYFISIKDKIFYPGRPGVSYGKAIGRPFIYFNDFKAIYLLTVIS